MLCGAPSWRSCFEAISIHATNYLYLIETYYIVRARVTS